MTLQEAQTLIREACYFTPLGNLYDIDRKKLIEAFKKIKDYRRHNICFPGGSRFNHTTPALNGSNYALKVSAAEWLGVTYV